MTPYNVRYEEQLSRAVQYVYVARFANLDKAYR